MSRCTVLLVKTGHESHLHSPVSFQFLFDLGLALDVGRQDYSGDFEETVVCVKVDVAIHLVWELLRSEERALGVLGQAAQGLVNEQQELCDAWVERVMEHAREVDHDTISFTWLAVCRTLARLNGEAFDLQQITILEQSLRGWVI